jgi:hypothetical protein
MIFLGEALRFVSLTQGKHGVNSACPELVEGLPKRPPQRAVRQQPQLAQRLCREFSAHPLIFLWQQRHLQDCLTLQIPFV